MCRVFFCVYTMPSSSPFANDGMQLQLGELFDCNCVTLTKKAHMARHLSRVLFCVGVDPSMWSQK